MLQPQPLFGPAGSSGGGPGKKKRRHFCAPGWHRQHKAISRAELLQLSFSSVCKALLITQDTRFSDLLIFALLWRLSAENARLAVLSPLSGCPDHPGVVGTSPVDIHGQQQSAGRSSCETTPTLQSELTAPGMFRPEDAPRSVSA